MTLEETLEKIHPANETAMEAALAHWNNIAMPLHSLGRLQDTVVRIAGMTGNARVDLKKKALVVMCADNGVVAQGVSQTDSSRMITVQTSSRTSCVFFPSFWVTRSKLVRAPTR